MRIESLVSPRLIGVYFPSDSLYTKGDDCPWNALATESIERYYASWDDLMHTIHQLKESEVPCVEMYPMAILIDMITSGEFYIGEGALVWTEIGGAGVPDGFTSGGYDYR